MALSPEALDAMVRSGATAEMIAAVVKADIQAAATVAEAAVEARRSRAAEAKRKQRAELRLAAKVLQSPQDMVGQIRTNEDTEGLGSPPLNPPQTPPIIPTPPTSLRSDKSRAKAANSGWFVELWSVLPHRPSDNRQSAEDKFCRLIRDAKLPDTLWGEILTGAQRYAAAKAGTDLKFIPATTVWLNQGRWRDDHAEPASGPSEPRRSRYDGPSMAEIATMDRNPDPDLFQSTPDVPRDRDPFEHRSHAADPRVSGFAGVLRQPDRGDAGGNVVDLQRAGAGWR